MMKTSLRKFSKGLALLSLPVAVLGNPFDPCVAYKTTDLQRLKIEKSKIYAEGTVDHRLVNRADHGISEVKDFLSCLQMRVLNDDARSIAQMISYPIRISPVGTVQNESQFLRLYPRVWGDRLKHEVMLQKYDDLIVKEMIGSSEGAIWFSGRVLKNGERAPIRIMRINP